MKTAASTGRLGAATRVEVSEILRDDAGRCAGVRCLRDGHVFSVKTKTVVLCGGGLQTPALLLRTPGGWPNLNVGRHLRLHPVCPVVATFDDERSRTAAAVCSAGALAAGGAPMTVVADALADGPRNDGYGCLVEVPHVRTRRPETCRLQKSAGPRRRRAVETKTRRRPRRDYSPRRKEFSPLNSVVASRKRLVAAAQVGLGLATAALPWAGGLDAKRANAEADRVVSFIALQRDIGEGSVSTASDGRPAVAYALDSRDAASLCRGVGAAGAALAAAGASTVKTLHLVDPPTWRRGGDVSEWKAAVAKRGYASDNRSTLLSAHQMGSCRIGKDASASAFDANGESWELPGLFVADASAFPTASGVNPMVSRPARKSSRTSYDHDSRVHAAQT